MQVANTASSTKLTMPQQYARVSSRSMSTFWQLSLCVLREEAARCVSADGGRFASSPRT
jgi:hypothetical protein